MVYCQFINILAENVLQTENISENLERNQKTTFQSIYLGKLSKQAERLKSRERRPDG